MGSTISTIVAFWTQKRTLAAAKAHRDSDRFETRKAQAYSLFFKLLRIHSNLAVLQKTLKPKKRQMTGADGDLGGDWQVVLPLANLPDRVKFTSDEMALLLSLSTLQFNELGPFDDVHNGVIEVFETYRAKRIEAMSSMSAKMKGNLGTTTFTQEEHDKMAPKVLELNMLVAEMKSRTDEEVKVAWTRLNAIHKLLVKEFDFHPKLQLKESANT
ncbi:hypothetical protein JJE66_19995 [Bradyrhizobium diazoefficiens]|uniref:hypothetical protein n=1 Tax=Bradyrhizobium diazoefficiens TaxID=1355477 RepID=UPI00190D9CDA|nr:hypothetical protein [Bradyrhizobium diazoefficiens]MBK3663492.1 hypothetical protein [Bradyrhizobium diazoefficiens]